MDINRITYSELKIRKKIYGIESSVTRSLHWRKLLRLKILQKIMQCNCFKSTKLTINCTLKNQSESRNTVQSMITLEICSLRKVIWIFLFHHLIYIIYLTTSNLLSVCLATLLPSRLQDNILCPVFRNSNIDFLWHFLNICGYVDSLLCTKVIIINKPDLIYSYCVVLLILFRVYSFQLN